MIADKDLLSIQHARILAENAFEAQKKLAAFSQEALDAIVEGVAEEVSKHVRDLAVMSHEETEYGRWRDKWLKNRFVCRRVRESLRGMRCVGVLAEDAQKRTLDVGVPLGVVVALCPATSPVSTTVCKTLLALKSGNSIIFSPHPRAEKSMGRALDIMIRAAQAHGLPEGCLSYLGTVTESGSRELMRHPATALIMITGVPGMLASARAAGKPVICGGAGGGPAFIERTADIERAAADIVAGKTFDNGMAPGAEQSVVVDAPVARQVRQALLDRGAHFMTEDESQKLAALLFRPDGRRNSAAVGLPAAALAGRAGFAVSGDAALLVTERKYVSPSDPYVGEFPGPVLPLYVEDDWRHACEKCIELLLHERGAHTMVIHSRDEDVIRQFALKKPVGRLLVNTPASFGGMGATTNLFPAVVLGGGAAGCGITADNVSPLNLVYSRKVGYGVRGVEEADKACSLDEPTAPAQRQAHMAPPKPQAHAAPSKQQQEHAVPTKHQAHAARPAPEDPAGGRQALRRILLEALQAGGGPVKM